MKPQKEGLGNKDLLFAFLFALILSAFVYWLGTPRGEEFVHRNIKIMQDGIEEFYKIEKE